MQNEPGDSYLRRVAAFIRTNEGRLAEAGFVRRRHVQKPSPQIAQFNAVGWFGPTAAPKPLVLSLDTHHLFYILMRIEAIGIEVGPLDVKVHNPSRPMSFINIFAASDKTDTLSLSSIRSSFSAVSALSLGTGWWRRPEPQNLDSELKYIYSSFTKLPALALSPPGRKIIKEMASEPPNDNATPLDAFKNLQILECHDIDPRTLLGWDRLAESLRSLTVSRSGVEDVSDIFIWAVADDETRREGGTSRWRQRQSSRRRPSFYSTRLTESIPEDEGPTEAISSKPAAESSSESQDNPAQTVDEPLPLPTLSALKWAFLKHLSLPDNALTFFPSEPLQYLSSVTHLDLSSNLLNSVPPGLSALHNLISLNLSDNMIDSVLGIYTNLGQILTLNLSRNRLESICGLERLPALERVDLRSNRIEDSAEVGRLATLPNIVEVWVEGNPFVEYEDSYRITCFNLFWKEGKSITLDGSPPSFYERRNLGGGPPEQAVPRSVPTAYSPPVVAVTLSHSNTLGSSLPPHSPPGGKSPKQSSTAVVAPSPIITSKPRRKKNKRIVELDGEQSDSSVSTCRHARALSLGTDKKAEADTVEAGPPQPPLSTCFPASPTKSATPPIRGVHRSRHSRHRSEMLPSPSPYPGISVPPSSSPNDGQSSPYIDSRSHAIARRARVAASTYEPPADKGGPDEYRKRIEALKSDMGEAWLKVFSQSQLGGVGAGTA